MFELIFLGTSAAAPTLNRSLTSQMILAGEHRFLIDCGEGTQRQILKSGLGFKRLNKVLLTHGHLDHILGLGGLVSTLARWEDLEQIEIWGGEPTLERVHNLIHKVVFMGQELPIPLHLHPLERDRVFFEGKKFTLQAFPVKHQGGGNFGFIFQERAHRPFLAEKAEALGLPSGPLRAQLVAGQNVTLPDGRVIQAEDILGESMAGAKLVYVGDCGNVNNLHEVAAGADCLVIEATYLDEDRGLAKQFGHLTAGTAARFAQEVGAKTLILNHLSSRNRESDIRREALQYFPQVYVARDFDHFTLVKGKPVIKKVAQADPADELL
jgi:ribonuclease Z